MANRQEHYSHTADISEALPDSVRPQGGRLLYAEYDLITFRVDRQIYALPVEAILQIISMVLITPFPAITGMRQPDGQALLGVINVHGAVTPVVDLRRHLGRTECPLQLYTPIILTYSQHKLLGLVVDEVVDVVHLDEDQLIPLTDIFPAGIGSAPILRGMANIHGELLPVLANDALFCELLTPEQSRSLNNLLNELPILPIATLDGEPNYTSDEPGAAPVDGDEP